MRVFRVRGHLGPQGLGMTSRASRRRTVRSRAGVALALGGALLAGCGQAAGGHSQTDAPATASPAAQMAVSPRPVSKAKRTDLPKATTRATLRKAPKDPKPFAFTGGRVLHPKKPTVLYARPGGPPIAVLPTTQLGSQTWVPIVRRRPGWARVLLPSRPNRASGWIYTAGEGLVVRHSPYVVRVKLGGRRLTVTKNGDRLGQWTVAVGASDTPTPKGRSFVLASLAPPKPKYSRLILPLGAHSDTLTTFGGGPGTVGFHTWPDSSVYGKAISHGCVRVPRPALHVLSKVPLGSLVLITR